MPRAPDCPKNLFTEVIKKCWARDPKNRPTFAEIMFSLSKYLRRASLDEVKGTSAEPTSEELLGLSAEHISVVARDLMKVSNTMTTTDAMSRMKRLLKRDRSSYASWVLRQSPEISRDLDGAPASATATVFVSHAWRYNFKLVCGVINEYVRQLRRDASPSNHPGLVRVRGHAGKWIYKAYFWFDIFTVNQFAASTYSQDFWTNTFKDQVKEIGHTLLILHPWNRPIPLTRAWCVWEMYCTVDTKARLDIRMPLNDSKQLEHSIMKDILNTATMLGEAVNAEKAEAWMKEDQDMIHNAIKDTVGFEKLNGIIRYRLNAYLRFMVETSETVFVQEGQGLERFESAQLRIFSDDAVNEEEVQEQYGILFDETPAIPEHSQGTRDEEEMEPTTVEEGLTSIFDTSSSESEEDLTGDDEELI
jgi:hypothetical protein